jgi:hypothetical protein
MMKNFLLGAYLVLATSMSGTNVELVAIGYKYNSQNNLCFIMTKDAGLTAVLGHHPYIAKFPNKFGNIKKQKVDHPEVISYYFEDSNAIDFHNHMPINLFWG